MNRTVLVGRLTKDIELKYTQNGKAVANFTIAVNRPFKNAQGETDADFIMCQSWGKQAENLANYMGKGSQIGVDGRIQTRNYEGQDGKRVYVTEVVADNVQFLEPKKQGNQQPQQPNQQQNNQQSQHNPSYTQQAPKQDDRQLEPLDISDSDLPF